MSKRPAHPNNRVDWIVFMAICLPLLVIVVGAFLGGAALLEASPSAADCASAGPPH